MPRPLLNRFNTPFKDGDENPITDNTMYISQVMVFDMNGKNIARNAIVTVTGQQGTIDPKIIIDGNTNPRTETLVVQGSSCYDANDRTRALSNPLLFNIQVCQSYVTLDLGANYQISSISFVGKLASTIVESRRLQNCTHMMVFQVLDSDDNQVYKDILSSGSPQQSLQCPNAFRIQSAASDPSILPSNPNLVSFKYGLQEVFCVNNVGPRSNAELVCNILGAKLATSGQLQKAYDNNAEWCTPGWVKDSTSNTYYPSQQKKCGGNKGINGAQATNAGAVCVGVKPPQGTANTENIQDFNVFYGFWSLHTFNVIEQGGKSIIGNIFGTTKFSVPNSTLIREYTQTSDYNFLPVKRLYPQWQPINPPTSGISKALIEQYNLSPPLPTYHPAYNPFYEIYLRGSPVNWLYDMRNTIINGRNLFTTFPLEQLGNDGKPKFKINVEIFGSVPDGGVTEFNNSLNLSTKIYLGSTEDIDKFVKIKIDDVGRLYPTNIKQPDTTITSITAALALPTVDNFNNVAYLRTNPPGATHPDFRMIGTVQTTSFCKPELVQIYDTATNQYKIAKAAKSDIDDNNLVCGEGLTSDKLGLLPGPTRQFLINWIYNRTARFIQQVYGVQYNQNNEPIDGYGNKLTTGQVSSYNTNLAKIQGNLKYMVPTAGGSPLPVDITNKYTLDTIAQSFYELMGGLYQMTMIYDISTIGKTMFDIRFDITKHKDNSESEMKIAQIQQKYYALRASNVSQDILDTAKTNSQDAIRDIRASQLTNIYPPITGVVGRFFYTYNQTTTAITITGITLDARAVTSFIPDLNGGIFVSTGSDAGSINYVPNTVYTMNVSQPLDCTDESVLRRIMDDYIDATKDSTSKGLASTLENATPSMDTTKGSIQIRSIDGAQQVSKTQCAITWKETLWDTDKNMAIVPDVTRNALFSYISSQSDWYSSDIIFDATGFKYYDTPRVPKCVFSPTAYQKSVSPVIDSMTTASEIQKYFLQNTFNNGAGGFPCADVLPLYKFNIYDYLGANPSLNTTYNSGSTIDAAGAINHYTTTGIGSGQVLRAEMPIPPLKNPIKIPQAIPISNDLDNANGACPKTSCDDLDVLYTIADGYNNDPTQPGTILRITRNYTANKYQCDIEADINYDVTTTNSEGNTVKKGSFTYSSDGSTELPVLKTLPSGLTKGVTFGMNVHMELATCKVVYDGTEGAGTGNTIQPNTPVLYKPLEYATEYANRNLTDFSKVIDGITGSIKDTARLATSALSTYRQNTVAAVGSIATLGACGAKCTDTSILNTILAYYKANPDKPNTQINKILYAGTLNETTCDITFQEDTLVKSGNVSTIQSSQTSAMRFTMAPSSSSSSGSGSGSGSCNFSVRAMSRTLPAPLDVTSPAFIHSNEVYYIDGSYPLSSAERICKMFNGVVATKAQVNSAMGTGADWCKYGWVADVSGLSFCPVSANIGYGCPLGRGLKSSNAISAGINCYGPKPPPNRNPFIKEFSKGVWSKNSFTPYVNPSKEGFQNYGPPIQVTESTFPLNTPSFGLDGARNKESHLETLYKEPLRHSGPKYLTEDEPVERKSYRYIRFRPMMTRDPKSESVSVGKFRFFLGKNEIDLANAKATNPMGTWVGDATDITGPGYKEGWTDHHKKSIIFAFPYPVLMDGFTWTTTNPDMGIGCDPVQWKLEGSQNGTFWTILRDQTRTYPVPTARFQELPIFKF
jgi:hypothetical protein